MSDLSALFNKALKLSIFYRILKSFLSFKHLYSSPESIMSVPIDGKDNDNEYFNSTLILCVKFAKLVPLSLIYEIV
jgi:hypothetical protein